MSVTNTCAMEGRELAARLRGAVGLLGAEVLQRLRPELCVAARRRVTQPHARLDQRRMVARRHVQLCNNAGVT